MQWDDSINAGFSDASEEKLYICIDPDKNRPTVKAQMEDETSLWHTVKTLINLRMNNKELQSEAPIEFIYAKPYEYPFVYTRGSGKSKLLVALNPSAREVSCDISVKNYESVVYSYGEEASLIEGRLVMQKESVSIFRVN